MNESEIIRYHVVEGSHQLLNQTWQPFGQSGVVMPVLLLLVSAQ